MKTYLVPIDFSRAADNSAEFAAALSHHTDVKHIILLNAYYVSPYETMLPSPDMVQLTEEDVDANVAERLMKLNVLKEGLYKIVRPGVKISVHLNRSHLVRAVIENSINRDVGLVILGSKGNSSSNDSQVGSHVIKISKASPVPVIIVPPLYRFQNIDRVVVACDFNKVTETVPIAALMSLLSRKKFELLVVNVDNKARHNELDAQLMEEGTALYSMLKQFNPAYYYISEPNIIDGILRFAGSHNAQLVIALPHKYSFLQSLMHNSVSQQLAEKSAVPVLLLK